MTNVKITLQTQRGSVLLISLFTITVMTLICATSLYVASQNTNAGMQTASWQQAMSGAQSAVDHAIATLNLNSTQGWTGWYTVNGSPPNTKPSDISAPATTAPSPSPAPPQYNYLVSTAPLVCPVPGASPEGSSSVTWWATVDTAGFQPQQDSNGNQWYRIRGTGQVVAPGPKRVSNQRLDNDLRMFSMFFDRKADPNNVLDPNHARASRTIEVVVQPIAKNIWARGITTRNAISMSGGGNILIADVDSFDSSLPSKSTLGLYDPTKRQSHGDVATTNSTNSDLSSTYVFGNLTYSGPPIHNTKHVRGTIATPFNVTIPDTLKPTWSPDFTYVGGAVPPFLTSGTKNNPAHIKIIGDFTVAAAQTITINNQDLALNNNYIEFWVTGKFTIAIGGSIVQNPLVHATWYVESDITVNGDSYVNLSFRAANLSFVGFGTNHKVTEAGIAPFWGTIDAPGFDVTISGIGGYFGAVIGNTLILNNLASIHYDEALKGSASNVVSNYAFASWIEDNSDRARGITF